MLLANPSPRAEENLEKLGTSLCYAVVPSGSHDFVMISKEIIGMSAQGANPMKI